MGIQKKVMFVTDDGVTHETEGEALLHEQKKRIRRNFALAISVAENRQNKAGERLPYKDSSLVRSIIIEAVMMMADRIGPELLAEIVSGNMSDEVRSLLGREITEGKVYERGDEL